MEVTFPRLVVVHYCWWVGYRNKVGTNLVGRPIPTFLIPHIYLFVVVDPTFVPFTFVICPHDPPTYIITRYDHTRLFIVICCVVCILLLFTIIIASRYLLLPTLFAPTYTFVSLVGAFHDPHTPPPPRAFLPLILRFVSLVRTFCGPCFATFDLFFTPHVSLFVGCSCRLHHTPRTRWFYVSRTLSFARLCVISHRFAFCFLRARACCVVLRWVTFRIRFSARLSPFCTRTSARVLHLVHFYYRVLSSLRLFVTTPILPLPLFAVRLRFLFIVLMRSFTGWLVFARLYITFCGLRSRCSPGVFVHFCGYACAFFGYTRLRYASFTHAASAFHTYLSFVALSLIYVVVHIFCIADPRF